MKELIRMGFAGLSPWKKVLTAIALALYMACALVYLVLEKLPMRRTP